MNEKIEEYRVERDGYSVGRDITHCIRCLALRTPAEVLDWIEREQFFGYHPAGYGGRLEVWAPETATGWKPTRREERILAYKYRWVHCASCD